MNKLRKQPSTAKTLADPAVAAAFSQLNKRMHGALLEYATALDRVTELETELDEIRDNIIDKTHQANLAKLVRYIRNQHAMRSFERAKIDRFAETFRYE